MELYLRDFLSDMLKRLLEGRGEEVREWTGNDDPKTPFARGGHPASGQKETLTDPLDVYRQKVKTGKRNASAP